MTSFVEFGVALAWGLALGWISGRLVLPMLQAPAFRRTNYRGAELGVGSGLVLVVAHLIAGGVGAALFPLIFHRASLGSGTWWALNRAGAFASVIFGFALLGLIDDLAAHGDDRGFGGHLRALSQGRLTTGALKLFGGAALGVGFSASREIGRPLPGLWILVDGAIVALAANAANLFDRAPGRCLKISALSIVALVAFPTMLEGWALERAALLFVLGVMVTMLSADLREAVMLGDTGANPLGAVIGMGIVVQSSTVRVVCLLVLVGLNVASEKVSFSKVIDATAPLRWADRLGARPERRAR